MKWFGAQILKRHRLFKDNRPPDHIRTADPVWLGPAHRKQLLCFVHIPKCAGTSFKNVLWSVYGRSFITYHRRISQYVPQEMTSNEAGEILALSGHLPYGYHTMFGARTNPHGVFADRDVIYVSIVRNPVDRLLSLARFMQTFRGHELFETTKNMTFMQLFDFLRAEKPGMIGNPQSRQLTAGRPRDAIEFAEKKYLAVSTIEKADAMITALAERLDWPKVHFQHKNKGPTEAHDDVERDAVEQFCQANCKLDMALYEHVAAKPGGFMMRDAGSA